MEVNRFHITSQYRFSLSSNFKLLNYINTFSYAKAAIGKLASNFYEGYMQRQILSPLE